MSVVRNRLPSLAVALLATAGAVGFAAPGQAADLPIKAPAAVMPVVVSPWAGGYFGSHIGFGWSKLLDSSPLNAQFDHYSYGLYSSSNASPSSNGSSFVYGSSFGYNWLSGIWLYGVEADLSRGNIDAESGGVRAIANPPGRASAFAGGDAAASLDWYGTLRVRAGALVSDRVLVYATGGLAYGKVDLHGGLGLGGSTGYGGRYSVLSPFHDLSIQVGWVVGAGIEWLHPWDLPLIRGAAITLQYQYVDLGEVSTTQAVSVSGTSGTARAVMTADAEAAFHVVRVGARWGIGGQPSYAAAAPYGAGPGPAYGWSGFYVGGHIGGIWSANDFLELVSTTAHFSGYGNSTKSGGAGGGSSFAFGTQGGYNWQSGAWVYGIEMDGTVTNLDTASSVIGAQVNPPGRPNVIAVGEAGASLGWIATVRGRLGYAFFDRTMIYGTGGIAFGKVNYHGSLNVGGSVGGGSGGSQGRYASFNESTTEAGWTLGGGIDYQVRPDLIASLGYLYVDLGTLDASAVAGLRNNGNSGTGAVVANTDLTFHMFKAGLSYRN